MKNIFLKLSSAVLVIGMAAALYSCYPEESTSVGDLDIVITKYDTSYIFKNNMTYIMPDTVIEINSDDASAGINASNQALILNQVAANLNQLGYTRVFDTLTQKPDVAVLLNGLSSTYWGTVWYDWWGYWGYYPYWPPYYGGYYPYYPYGGVTYSYEVGTLLMQMIDFRTSKNDSLNIVWIGAVNGVLEGSNQTTRLKNGIDQAFEQSPYL